MGLYVLNKILKIARQNGLTFIQIKKVTMKIYSSLSNTNICYYLKLPIPIMHRQFFRIISQNPEYVKTHCKDMKNPLGFVIGNWMNNQN